MIIKIKVLFLTLISFALILNCKDKIKADAITHFNAAYQKEKISDYLINKYLKNIKKNFLYFDANKEMAFNNILLKDLGQLTVYYLSKKQSSVQYIKNFVTIQYQI